MNQNLHKFNKVALKDLVEKLKVDREFFPNLSSSECRVEGEVVAEKWKFFEKQNPLGAYVHIPFCSSICTFCHFGTHVPGKNEIDEYIDLVVQELALYKDSLDGHVFDTLYIGGGTPSILSVAQFHRLYDSILWTINLDSNCQITVEINPDSLTEKLAEALAFRKVHRISMGVQSFDGKVLDDVNRGYQKAEHVQFAVKILREFGISNISIDLMAGLPNQSSDSFIDSVKKTIDINVDSISIYPFEAFASKIGQNGFKQSQKDFEKIYDIIETTEPLLFKAGYIKPLRKTMYTRNLKKLNRYDYDRYQRAGSVACFGDNSYGHIFASLKYKAIESKKRREALELGRLPQYIISEMDKDTEMREYIVYNINLGINRGDFLDMFSQDITEAFPEAIQILENEKWIKINKDNIIPNFKSQTDVVIATMAFFTEEEMAYLYRKLED